MKLDLLCISQSLYIIKIGEFQAFHLGNKVARVIMGN